MKFFRVPFNSEGDGATPNQPNQLHEYIQSQSMQDMARLASEISPQVKQIIAGNVQALLGHLPGQEFQTTVAAEKGSFQNLLASAMVTGYFMHAMENRMKMESIFSPEEIAKSSADKQEQTKPSDLLDPLAELSAGGSESPSSEMQKALQQLMKSRLRAAEPKENLKKPEDLFGSLLEKHIKELESLEQADKLGEFVSGEALRKVSDVQKASVPAAPAKQDKLKIQLEINTEMGQQALTDLIEALGVLRQRES